MPIYKHGLADTRVYQAWVNMKRRCTDPKDEKYPSYGGRGISYDPRWEDVTEFFKDMGHCPKGLSLDRIDNNGDYTKENCRWATRRQQALNTRVYSSNKSKIPGVNRDSGYWKARATNSQGVRLTLYRGVDFFEACCRRKSWEYYHGNA